MPTKRKPLPRLPRTCPLCKKLVRVYLCGCGRPVVVCKCTIGVHGYGITERRARKSWLARIAAKQKAAKGKR